MKNQYVLYDILPIMLRDPNVITNTDAERIYQYYTVNKRETFLDFSQKEKALPFVAYTLSKIGIEKGFWSKTFEFFMRRSEKIIELLDDLFAMAKRNGVESLCVVENFGSVLCSGIPVGCFSSDDVDLTADASEKKQVLHALEKVGFRVGNRGHHASDSSELTKTVWRKERNIGFTLCGGLFHGRPLLFRINMLRE